MSNVIKIPHRNHQHPLRLHGWHLDDALENQGVGPISRKEEIWKLICSLLDVFLAHPICQKPPRLLSGTISVLLDSMDDALENPGVGLISRKEDIWKLICRLLDISLGHPLCQKPLRLNSGTTSVLSDSMDDTWMTLWRTQELDLFPKR